MKPSSTMETKRLAKTDAIIARLVTSAPPNARTELRLQLLEAAASRFGGFDLEAFLDRFSLKPVKRVGQLIDDARAIVQSIDDCGIHPALALSALARETLDEPERRTSGAYHTDFRLALHLARCAEHRLKPDIKVIDPACGAGILLAAVSAVACRSDRILASEWIRNCVYAADLSPLALRGSLIALSTFSDDLDALASMRAKWQVQDSLLVTDDEWTTLAPDGFDLVVANPPWEKIKLSRHEYSKANGESRHYGASYREESLTGYETAKSTKAKLASQLVRRYPALASGEPDLYVAFTELSLKLTRPGGSGSLIVPAGLIRSLNTRHLRTELLAKSEVLEFTIMENRARHFAIDTRFKFLLVNYVKAAQPAQSCKKIGVVHATASDDAMHASKAVNLPLATLAKLRADLTFPEVRSTCEWKLFKKMQEKGTSPECPESRWYPDLCREVDMTHGRRYFRTTPAPGCVPVIEGRMVQPHRLGCKSYVSGEGRSAVWLNLPPGQSTVRPQFWIPVADLGAQAGERTQRARAGFCDITGQTNERSMMAALIPPNTVCGNKVPTIEFPNDSSEERILLWLAIVNSFPFDWMLRRIVTTTVNYFVLRSLKLPAIQIDSLPARRLIEIAKRLFELDASAQTSFETCWNIARLKAEADVIVTNAYGCTEADLQLMLQDFPLIDRGQPCLQDETRSSVTSDLLLHEWSRRKRKKSTVASKRLAKAMKLGAIAYLSSEFVSCVTRTYGVAHEQ